jgi:homoserine dehydrogenase
LGELLDVGKNIFADHYSHSIIPGIEGNMALRTILDLEASYYIRMTVSDEAGVFGKIAEILGSVGISIASVIQKDADEEKGTAEIVITTHISRECQIQKSLAILSDLSVVSTINNVIRIDELST